MEWTKVNSVITGGKPYFYTAKGNSDVRYWVSWSRHDSAWSVGYSIQGSRADSGFKTSKKAMHYTESLDKIGVK